MDAKLRDRPRINESLGDHVVNVMICILDENDIPSRSKQTQTFFLIEMPFFQMQDQ